MLTAATFLVMVVGCQRQSPRFQGQHAPASSSAITPRSTRRAAQTVTLQMTDLLRFVPSTVLVTRGQDHGHAQQRRRRPAPVRGAVAQRLDRQHPRPHVQDGDLHHPQGTASYPFDCAYHTSEHMVGTLTVQGF